MDKILKKLSLLWEDSRPFKKRLLTAFLANLFLAFTLIVYTPSEMFLNSLSDFSFSFGSAVGVLAVFAIIYLIVSVGITSLLRGKVFDAVVSAVFAFTLCCYIQGNFLNGSLSILNGEAVDWTLQTKTAVLGLILWAVIFSVPFILRYFSRGVWENVIRFASFLHIIMQAVALVTLLVSTDFSAETSTKYLSKEDLYSVSDKNNVIVLLTDYFDNDYLDMMLDDDPDAFEELRGFTRYTNFTSVYKQTMPTIPYLFTASDWRLQTSAFGFAHAAFEESIFLDEVAETGAKIDLYSKTGYLSEKGISYAYNCTEDTPQISYTGLIKSMMNYVMYRDLPVALKAPFWFYTDDISNASVKKNEDSDDSNSYMIDDVAFYDGLKKNGVTVSEYEYASNFKFIHLMGGHSPYVMNENGEASNDATALAQYKGCFKIIYEYLDDLKASGAYDNSTIIIMSDHGVVYVQDELTVAPTPILFIKPAGADADSELKYSAAPVSQADFHATVLKALGADESVYSEYGRTFFDTSEDEDRERYFYFRVAYDGSPVEKILEYVIDGDANDIANWHLTGNTWE